MYCYTYDFLLLKLINTTKQILVWLNYMINFYTIGGRKSGEVILDANKIWFSDRADEPK